MLSVARIVATVLAASLNQRRSEVWRITSACSRVAVVHFFTLEIPVPQPADAGRSPQQGR